MTNHQFSTPSIKIRIKDVRYTVSGGTVHCFLTMENMWRTFNDPYMELVACCERLGMRYGVHTQYRCICNSFYRDYVYASADKYIYIPSDYEYHGMATLKAGDIEDFELAKRIAYKKAYRQLCNFYYNCYYNLYDFINAYSADVWYGQLKQLAARCNETENDVMNMIE